MREKEKERDGEARAAARDGLRGGEMGLGWEREGGKPRGKAGDREAGEDQITGKWMEAKTWH